MDVRKGGERGKERGTVEHILLAPCYQKRFVHHENMYRHGDFDLNEMR